MLLIDGDTIAYRCAASCEPRKAEREAGNNEPEEEYVAKGRINQIIEKLYNAFPGQETAGWIGGGENFRYVLYPEYKYERRDKPLPTHLAACREYLVDKYNFKVANGVETDDEIAIHHNDLTIVVSVDKDLRQLAGKHYNFVKDIYDEVSLEQATRNFWAQMLIGDSSDGIPGIPRIGEARAAKLLNSLIPEEYATEVLSLYQLHDMEHQFAINLRLLGLVRSEEEKLCILEAIYQGESFTHCPCYYEPKKQ